MGRGKEEREMSLAHQLAQGLLELSPREKKAKIAELNLKIDFLRQKAKAADGQKNKETFRKEMNDLFGLLRLLTDEESLAQQGEKTGNHMNLHDGYMLEGRHFSHSRKGPFGAQKNRATALKKGS